MSHYSCSGVVRLPLGDLRRHSGANKNKAKVSRKKLVFAIVKTGQIELYDFGKQVVFTLDKVKPFIVVNGALKNIFA